MRKFFLLILLFCTIVPVNAIRIKSEPRKEKIYPEVEPAKLYDKVWRIIKNDYVDQHYNSQDWQIWRHRYDAYLETRAEAVIAIKTMVTSLGDRYTRFLDRKAFEEEKESIDRLGLIGCFVCILMVSTEYLYISPVLKIHYFQYRYSNYYNI